MEIVDIIFLIIIASTSFWLFFMISGYGGSIGQALRLIAWGVVLMALSHIFDDVLRHFFNLSSEVYDLFYHLFVAISFLMVAYGFRMFVKK